MNAGFGEVSRSGVDSSLSFPSGATSARRSTGDEASGKLGIDRICCINLKRRPDRWERFLNRVHRVLLPQLGDRAGSVVGAACWESIERFEAVDGSTLELEAQPNKAHSANDPNSAGGDDNRFHLAALCSLQWDATNNARWDRSIRPPYARRMTHGEVGCALSHVRLWQELASSTYRSALILEDDIIFYPGRSGTKPGFFEALEAVHRVLPSDWDIWYLGFCNFGPKTLASGSNAPFVFFSTQNDSSSSMSVRLYRPSYGFYTHAYAITKSAVAHLLSQLPVAAPLDVWLADNDWFGLNVYFAEVPSPDRSPGATPRGVSLISQLRTDSDIVHSAHHCIN